MAFSPSVDVTLLELVHCELSSHSDLVDIVMKNFLKYDTLEIRGNIYYNRDWTEEIANDFWNTLSKTVTHITVHEFEEIFSEEGQEKCSCKAYLSQLTGLTVIQCHWKYLNHFLTDDFLDGNTTLEVVRTHFYFPDQTFMNTFMITDFYPHKGPNYGDFFISEEIIKLLTHCKSLKSIGIPCHFVAPNTMCAFNETASLINARFLELETVILIGDILPKKVNKCCKVTGIKIGIDREQKTMIFSVISLELGPGRSSEEVEKVRQDKHHQYCHESEYVENESAINVQPTCFFDHRPHLNEQVKILTIDQKSSNTCEECWCNLFQSFPNIRNIYCKTFMNASTLQYISRYLKEIRNLSLKFNGSLKDWPPIPSLWSLSVDLYSKSTALGDDDHVSRNCSSLTSLCVRLGKKCAMAVAYKEFMQNLGEKWDGIKELTIDELIRMNAQDLQAIEHCLKELKMLDIGCNEGERRILQLFLHLERLELIIYRNANGIKKVLTRNHYRQAYSDEHLRTSSAFSVTNSTEHLSLECTLPIEIWTQIFANLSYKDHLTCRIVSWKWRQILSSFGKFHHDRILTLQNCVMDLYMEPMDTFSQTTFNYEILRVGGNVTVVGYKELSDFFKKIGKEIKMIQFLTNANVFELVDLHENGLNRDNLPKLRTLQIEKSSIFGALIQESESFNNILEGVQHLRFESLKLAEMATWPQLTNITSLEMNVLYSVDNSFLCQSWPKLNKVSIGFVDGIFNGRLIIFQVLPLLRKISRLELGLLILDAKILDVISSYSNSCTKLEVLCISASNIKQLSIDENARMLFERIATLKEISFGETSIRDQQVRMKGFVTFRRSQSCSGEMEIEDACQCSFFQKKFEIKVLKINDVNTS